MKRKQYYSMRTGKNTQAAGLDFNMLQKLFFSVYGDFLMRDYFQEAFGYDCVDAGFVPGTLGHNLEDMFLRKLRKDRIWPINENYQSYSEHDLFDVIEFLFDHVSTPVDGNYHSWSDCGWHYSTFDKSSGQNEFRAEINQVLGDYDEGFELSETGEILLTGQIGLDKLFEASIPSTDPQNIELRIQAAIAKFRKSRSTFEDRRDAIRDLADVLEFLRPKLKMILVKKDENDLFNIANNFGIRHHNEKQQVNYDKKIWYSWMFYYYLATIHTCLRLIEKNSKNIS